MRFIGMLTRMDIRGSSCFLAFKSGGRSVLLRDDYRPYFYAVPWKRGELGMDEDAIVGLRTRPYEEDEYLAQAMGIILQHPDVMECSVEKRIIGMDLEERKVIKVMVRGADAFRKVAGDLKKVPHIKEMAEVNVPHYFRYSMERGLRFFETYEVEARGDRLVSAIRCEGVHEELTAAAFDINDDGSVHVLTDKGLEMVLDSPSVLSSFLSFNSIDVAFSFGGDSFLRHGKHQGIFPSQLGCFIQGCLHMDIQKDMSSDIYNDITVADDGMLRAMLSIGRERIERTVELSFMSGAKPEMVSRVSPGRLNTYLHMESARAMGFMVPDSKKGMESPKSLQMLGMTDKGGLIFYPEPGVYRNLAKLDFASMYPSIIVNYNISPETLNCGCCATDPKRIHVPDTDWHICIRRKGIIPLGIRSVLKRRLELKRAMRNEKDPAARRGLDVKQKALKNILVTCFGYLGFKNFIFSRAECKECVMLFGRHIMLEAKSMAEDAGLNVVYGITDSIFLSGGSGEQYLRYADSVSSRIGIGLDEDCIFTAVAFPSARDGSGIANKYYGLTRDGGIEARGIMLRHSDAPGLLKEFQKKAIRLLLSGDWDQGCRKARQLAWAFKLMLRYGSFGMDSLSVTKRLRRPIEEYESNAPHVVAYRQLASKGQVMTHGDSNRRDSLSGSDGRRRPTVTYVWAGDQEKGPKPVQAAGLTQIDKNKYAELIDDGLEEMIRGLV